jgi:hypothetical protein
MGRDDGSDRAGQPGDIVTNRSTAPTPPAGGDGQVIGHLIAAFTGVFLTVLVDFGVPLSDAQQRDLLSLVVTGWALFAGTYAWLARAKHPVTAPPAPSGPPPSPQAISDTTRLAAYTDPEPPPAPGGYHRATGTATVRPSALNPPTWPPYNPVHNPGTPGGNPPDQLPRDPEGPR